MTDDSSFADAAPTVRSPAVAGAFYPASAQALRKSVAALLAQQETESPVRPYAPKQLRAIIAPHAGYVYSGSCAAAAYALLRPLRGRVQRVVLVGPSHRFAFRGIAQCSVDAYQSPLGSLAVDGAAREAISGLPEVVCEDRAHAAEHALEVHLPFVQQTLGAVSVVPLVVGGASLAALVRVLSVLLEDPQTLLVVSSDLSHFLDAEAAHRLDQQTTEGIAQLDPAPLADDNSACGRFPIAALIQIATRRGWRPETLATCTSAQANGNEERVVGYGAWAFWQPTSAQAEDEAAMLLATHGAVMEQAARASISHGLSHGTPLPLQAAALPSALRLPGACFVTLYHGGRLRGCVGSLQAWRRLDVDLLDNAYKAAFGDGRFAPLTAEEWPQVSLSLTLLTPPQPLEVRNRADLLERLRPGVDGLIVQDGSARAIFLPMVWQQIPIPEDFLAHLLQKANLPPNHWTPSLRAYHFTCRSR
jgi:AmmeMemoRadiSam system protein B/AmmeMemoRadiSam system protein A